MYTFDARNVPFHTTHVNDIGPVVSNDKPLLQLYYL